MSCVIGGINYLGGHGESLCPFAMNIFHFEIELVENIIAFQQKSSLWSFGTP